MPVLSAKRALFTRPLSWFFLCYLIASLPCFGQATWVHFGPGGTLVYTNDNLGNRLIDYSYAGYEGGGVALPTNEVVQTNLSVVAGDNTAQIQNAINYVGGLPANADGIRGVVLLNPGTYPIAGTLSISQGGVVLRGSGTNTVLDFTNTNSTGTAINISGSSGATQSGSTYLITDSYVPLGATNFHLNTTVGLSVGTGIVVRRPWETNWVNAIGMSNYWTAAGHQNDAERQIMAISGNEVTVDIPLPTPIEQAWCVGEVFPYTDSGRVQQCAVENLSMYSAWGLATTGNTNGFGWTGINFGNAKNCWVRNIAFNGFGGEAINTSPDTQSKWITAQDCTYANGVNNGSARPGAFQIEGQMCLYQRLTGISGFEHLCQSLDEATGPNVFLNCNSTGSDFDGGPHRFWAVGLLTDNEYGTVGNVHITIITGGDNGWGAGYSVFYNCHTSNHTIQCPAVTNHYNWWIGGSGVNNDPTTDPGTYDHDGTTVAPNSLYLEQLKERLGGAAVENIGYALFTISNTPATESLNAGAQAAIAVNVGDPTLMSNVVALSVSGLPANLGASFNTNAVTGQGNATLTVTASNSIVPGTYVLNIIGTSAGLSHTSEVSLVVGSFGVSAEPASEMVLAGSNAVYTVTLTTNSSFSGTVNFGLDGLPSGAAAAFDPASLNGNGNSTLTVTTTGNMPPGSYPLTIFATNGATVVTSGVTLSVSNLTAAAGMLYWTNGAADLNWSSSLNWTNVTAGGSGVPGLSNDVKFVSASAANAVSNVDNIVNGSFAINSLQYENTNGFHTTLIEPGRTLTIGGLTVGTETDNGSTQAVYTVITGPGGILNVNNTSSNLVVRQGSVNAGSSLKATLDLSGLDTLVATVDSVQIGSLGANARPSGTLYLAKTNLIVASGPVPAIQIGGQGGGSGNGGNGSFLYLGETNAIFANGISVATVKQGNCSLLFNPAFAGANPVAVFRAADGVSPVPSWFVADSQSQGGTVNTTGTNDFSSGTVDALVNNLTVARSSIGSGTGNPSGTLTLGAGIMSIGTLEIGYQGSSGANYPTATVNLDGPGLMVVTTNLELAHVVGGAGATNTTGNLNLNGGTLEATNIFGGGGISTINLESGTLDLQAGFPVPGQITNVDFLNIGSPVISAGALLENATAISVSNVVTVAANGTLAGNTLVTAPGLDVNGSIEPGVNGGVGTITTSGSVSLGSGGNFVVVVENVNGPPGTGWDFLEDGGQLNVLAAGTNPFVINPQSYDPDNSGLVTNFDNNTNYDWPIATAAGGITNFSANKFAVDSSLFGNDLAGGYFYVRSNLDSLILSFTNNHPPAAATATFYRPGPILLIPIATLATNWSDPDGDPVILDSLNSSTNGAALATDGTYIYYTNNNSVADEILYTVQDVRTNPPAIYRTGDTVRTAIGQIIVLPPPVIGQVNNTGTTLILSGAGGSPGGTYYVLSSTNLALPFNDWTVVTTNVFGTEGNFSFTNVLGSDDPGGFYLLKVP